MPLKSDFNFSEFHPGVYLLTNTAGRFIFLQNEAFHAFCNGKPTKETLLQLKHEFFYSLDNKEVFTANYAHEVRKYRDYLFSGTGLHIFVLTSACNLGCLYCQASTNTHGNMMSIETAEKCVDLALQSPNNYLSFEFQGGEPLLNFKTIEHIVKYTKMHQGLKKISFNLVSNLTILDEYKINFIKQHHISVSTSLDGDSTLHNINRPCLQGNSYEIWAKNYKILQSQLDCNIGAIQTTTKYSLNKYKEIVDEYIHNGLETVFLRPLTPLGYAATRWDELGYTAEDFVSFYDKSLKYIIERAKNGANIREGHASLFLCKILDHVAGNYTELRSPCGAALGQLAYNYDGAIYTCDEGRMMAEMGDHSFRVGTVHSNYKDLVTGSICKSMAVASCLESIPQCSDCVYSPYCGVCPVLNYASHGNIFADMPNHFKCKIYSGMLDSIFDLLLKNDAATQFILKSWTGNR